MGLVIFATYYSNPLIWYSLNDHPCVQLGVTFLAIPVSLVTTISILLLSSILVKKVIVGEFKSQDVLKIDCWASFKWLLANALVHELCSLPLSLANEYWLTASFWRAMGAKIGNQTRINPGCLIFEADMLNIGNNCHIESLATLLCHKFNKGGLKIDYVTIPSDTHIGPRAVILPGCEIVDKHVTILALTPVIPGEQLTTGEWGGSPSERISLFARPIE